MCDTIIKNGTIVDGTGSKPFIGDIAIHNGKIMDIGKNLTISAANVVDATGLTVTPGWVDPHTHYDAQVMWDEYLTPSAPSGVTTLVMGNCAVGLAPCQKPMRQFVTDLCDSIEDIPADVLTHSVGWNWETFPEYMNVMEKKALVCDVGILVGHSAVRSWVLGSRVNASDIPEGQKSSPLSHEEMEKIGKVVEEAVASGALGFSSSRVSIHRDQGGVLLPGSLASHEELHEIGKGIQRGGGGVFELASSWNLYDDWVKDGQPKMDLLRAYNKGEWSWIGKMAKLDGVTFTTGGGTGMAKKPNHAFLLKRLNEVNQTGGDMWSTPMMRNGTLFFGIEADINPIILSKIFRTLKEKHGNNATPALYKELRMPNVRESIINELKRKSKRSDTWLTGLVLDHSQFVWPWSNDPERKLEDSVKYSMKHSGKDSITYMYDILTNPEEPHGGVLSRALYNYGTHDMEPLREFFLDDKVVAGFADGGAHMKLQCEATAPTTMLTFWCRDRTRGPQLPIELVVKKQTYDSARMMGLTDRGTLQPGMKADINVIDMKTLNCLPPRFKKDLPLGAGRWTQDVVGYRMTMCNGVITYENGVATGALPGRVAKNPRSTGIVANGLKGSVPPGDVIEGGMSAKGLKEFALAVQSQAQGFSAIQKTLNNAKL